MGTGHLLLTSGGDGVLRVSGSVDEEAEEAFAAALEEASLGWTTPLVVDLTGVTFFPSRAISRALAAQRAAEEAGVGLVLVAPPASVVARVLRGCGLADRFHLRDSVEAPGD